MNNYEVLKEGDIVKIFFEDKDQGYYFLKRIEFDKEDECGLWWSIYLERMNSLGNILTWKIDDSHLRQEPFYMNEKKFQIVLYARPGVIVEEKEEKVNQSKQDNISLF